MRKMALLVLMTTIMAPSTAGAETLRDRWAQRMAARMQEPPAPGATEHPYGTEPLQTLDYWPAKEPKAPLVIFVHGGAWKKGDKDTATGATKVMHWREAGYAVASLDYRLVPMVTVEEQAGDVANAIGWLRDHAGRLGYDPDRIVLIGHSAGAHLAALVGTDLHYLAKAGVPIGAIRGIVLLDGAAYDVPAQLKEGAAIMHDTYEEVFGTDPARQRALSPTLQADAPDIGNFLILHVDREDGTRQSETLAAALRKAGAAVTLKGFEGRGLRGHMEINRMLGDPAYPATAVVDQWIAARFNR
ncbi:MAG: alpha/beta hydrolase [Sphingomonadales bacterium]|nr:MAG: alpha/beta hydrolase [Sphingomonadales bacterium]